MKTRTIAASILFSLILFSCKKQNTSEIASFISYQLKAINPTVSVNRTATPDRIAATSIQWTSGIASVTQIKFEAKTASGETEFRQAVTQQVDLFAAASSLGNITLPPGTYTELEFKAFLNPTGNAQALVLNGTLTTNGTAIPVSFQVNSPTELKAEKSAVTVVAGTTYSALNNLDLSGLTHNVKEADLSAAVRTNGVIVLSEISNNALYKAVLANLNSHHGEAEIEHR